MRSKVSIGARCMILGVVAASGLSACAEDCKRITDSAKRLECFDRASSGKPASPPVPHGAIQDAVRKGLKDPGSAQFGATILVAPDRACQTVNARNAFGGYTGNQQAFVMKIEGHWVPVAIRDVSTEQCTSIIKQLGKDDSTKKE